MNEEEKSHSLFHVHMKVFLLVLLLFITSQYVSESPSPNLSEKEMETQIKRIETEQEWNKMYEKIVDTLKYHEGYRAYPYYCLANVRTVGYGHAIKKGEQFNYPMTKEQADSLLRADLDAAISYVKRTTDLEHMQLLAISHFVYALGSGNFSRSTLKQRIVADESIDEEIVRWIHIRTKSGRIIRSDWLKASRKMELELYNLET